MCTVPPANLSIPGGTKSIRVDRYATSRFRLFETRTGEPPHGANDVSMNEYSSLKASSKAATYENPVTCPLMVLPLTVAPTTGSHAVCVALVLYSAGATPAGSFAGSKGTVMVTAAAKVVPCGVKA